MTIPSQDIGINHCTEADQDQACTNVRSNPAMEQNQEQYHENVFGHHVAEPPSAQLPPHMYGIAAQHNDAATDVR